MFAFRRLHADRLKANIAAAQKKSNNLESAINELRTGLSKEAQGAIQEGNTEVIIEAYQLLLDFYQRANQFSQAVNTLDEFRHFAFGQDEANYETGKLVQTGKLSESELVRTMEWLVEAGQEQFIAKVLPGQVDERFPRSALLAERLGDALKEVGEYHAAADRYRLAWEGRRDLGATLLPKLQSLADLAPQDQLVQETAGLVLFRERDYAQAALRLSKAMTLGELSESSLFVLADANLELRRYDGALQVIERLLKRLANPAELIRRCERLIDRHPEHDDIYYNTIRAWGDVLKNQSNYEEALEKYQQAVEELTPQNQPDGFSILLVNRLEEVALQVPPTHTAAAFFTLAQAQLLSGNPPDALAAYQSAVKADGSMLRRVIEGVSQVVNADPKLMAARLYLADLQMEAGSRIDAFKTLEAIRHDLPALAGQSEKGYRQLLKAFERTGGDPLLARGKESASFSGTLLALADISAPLDPKEALGYLHRDLNLFGSEHAEAILTRLGKLRLLDQAPYESRLLAGAAQLLKGDPDMAIKAYTNIPLRPDTVDEVCRGLNNVAEVDNKHANAWLAAAEARFTLHQDLLAVPFLVSAFERQPEPSAKVITQRLGSLWRSGACPPTGFTLLADAYIHQGTEDSLRTAVEVIRQGFESTVIPAPVALRQAHQVQKTAKSSPRILGQAILLAGDLYLATQQPGKAVETYMQAVHQPGLAENEVIDALVSVTRQAPDLGQAWIALAQAHRSAKKPAVDRALECYQQAVRVAPAASGKEAITELDRLTLKEPWQNLHKKLIIAEAYARTGDSQKAIDTIQSVIDEFSLQEAFLGKIDEVQFLINLLPEALPHLADKHLLLAQVDIAAREYGAAASQLEAIIEPGERAQVERCEDYARKWAETYPDHPTFRLIQAQALSRLGKVDQASDVLGQVISSSPAVEARAMALLEKITKTTPNPVAWLNRAKGFVQADNVTAAIDAFGYTLGSSATQQEAYSLVQKLAERHADHPGVLQTLVKYETRLGGKAHLAAAIEHLEAWSQNAPEQAEQLAEQAREFIDALHQAKLGSSALAQRGYLTWCDAYQRLQDFAQQEKQLRQVFVNWPEASNIVQERCQQTLEQAESPAIRLLYADTCLARQEYASALEVCSAAPQQDRVVCMAISERCAAISHAVQPDQPELACKAEMARAELLLRCHELEAVVEACQKAMQFAPEQVPAISGWLFERGWDEDSQRKFKYRAASFLRLAGGDYLELALDSYRMILYPAFEQERPAILQALAEFPVDYLPAWLERIEINRRAGVKEYEQVFNEMRSVLEKFGVTQAPVLLEITHRMESPHPEATHPGVYQMRAEIHEAAGELTQACQALLDMQQELPHEFERLATDLNAIIDRHPEAPGLRLFCVDANCRAGYWEKAFRAGQQAQTESMDLSAELEPRYLEILDHLPGSASVRWALANTSWYLNKPDDAARYLDELTELDLSQALPAEKLLAEILARCSKCAWGWYVRGKLMFQEAWPARVNAGLTRAANYFETALQGEGLPEDRRILLHDMAGRSYQAVGYLPASLEHLRQAVTRDPERPEYRKALINTRLAMLDSQIDSAKTSLDTQPDSPQLISTLGNLLGQRGRWDEVVHLIQGHREIAQRNGSLLLILGRAFAAQGQYHLASIVFQDSLASDGLSQADLKEALFRLAQSLRKELRYPEAIRALERLCSIDITYQNAVHWLDAIQHEKVVSEQQAMPLQPVELTFYPQEGE